MSDPQPATETPEFDSEVPLSDTENPERVFDKEPKDQINAYSRVASRIKGTIENFYRSPEDIKAINKQLGHDIFELFLRSVLWEGKFFREKDATKIIDNFKTVDQDAWNKAVRAHAVSSNLMNTTHDSFEIEFKRIQEGVSHEYWISILEAAVENGKIQEGKSLITAKGSVGENDWNALMTKAINKLVGSMPEPNDNDESALEAIKKTLTGTNIYFWRFYLDQYISPFDISSRDSLVEAYEHLCITATGLSPRGVKIWDEFMAAYEKVPDNMSTEIFRDYHKIVALKLQDPKRVRAAVGSQYAVPKIAKPPISGTIRRLRHITLVLIPASLAESTEGKYELCWCPFFRDTKEPAACDILRKRPDRNWTVRGTHIDSGEVHHPRVTDWTEGRCDRCLAEGVHKGMFIQAAVKDPSIFLLREYPPDREGFVTPSRDILKAYKGYKRYQKSERKDYAKPKGS